MRTSSVEPVGTFHLKSAHVNCGATRHAAPVAMRKYESVLVAQSVLEIGLVDNSVFDLPSASRRGLVSL